MDPFMWGAGGQKVSPQQQIAQSLAAADMSPVAHPLQGLSRAAGAGLNSYQSNPMNYFPDQPGGNTFMGGMTGLGSRLFGGGGGLY